LWKGLSIVFGVCALRLLRSYSVSLREIEDFVVENEVVAGWLGRYKGTPATFAKYSRGLCMFFKWLREVKGLKLSPVEFLDVLASKRASAKPSERCWGKSLVLQFSRDNPDLEGKADSTMLTSYIVPVKRFCADNEVELTSEQSLMGVVRRKWSEPAYTVELARKVLGALSQRDRAVCMIMLQAGQSISQVLVDVSKQGEHVIEQINMGKERIRLDFAERKGNNFPYHSFISRDAITEIKKWLAIRQFWLERWKKESKFLFITETCAMYRPALFLSEYTRTLQRHGLWNGPLSVRSHMFRKIFETEASPPDRGVAKEYVKFMMGHSSGTEVIKRQDMPGGVYDNAPRIYLDVVEREYEKLEPFINIYTGRRAEAGLSLTATEIERLRWIAEKLEKAEVKDGKLVISVG